MLDNTVYITLLESLIGSLTKHISSVDLHNKPAVFLVRIRAEDSEDGALLTRFSQQLVHIYLLLRELELLPGFPLVSTESEPAKDKIQLSVTS